MSSWHNHHFKCQLATIIRGPQLHPVKCDARPTRQSTMLDRHSNAVPRFKISNPTAQLVLPHDPTAWNGGTVRTVRRVGLSATQRSRWVIRHCAYDKRKPTRSVRQQINQTQRPRSTACRPWERAAVDLASVLPY
jgi:hypothetical protein